MIAGKAAADVAFMRDLEARYRAVTGLPDRSQYKIFYGPIRAADVLLLGINPGGKPAEIMPDGRNSKDGVPMHAASSSYYEKDESDLLDCDWTENRGLLKVLLPLLDGDREAVRRRVVKTNIAFLRSPKVVNVDIESAKAEAAPFLVEIIDRVRPQLVLLAGVKLEDFTGRFCRHVEVLGEAIRDPGVKQTVFRAARVELRATSTVALVVQVAHASQFSWTYEKYGVVQRIREVWGAPSSDTAARGMYAMGSVSGSDPTVASVNEPEPRATTRTGADAGINVAAYEALFRRLGFAGFESHKKLRHPGLPITLYFNRDKAGFVYFTTYAKDADRFRMNLWDVIPARQQKDKDPKLRTVVPKAGHEEAAFRDLLKQ